MRRSVEFAPAAQRSERRSAADHPGTLAPYVDARPVAARSAVIQRWIDDDGVENNIPPIGVRITDPDLRGGGQNLVDPKRPRTSEQSDAADERRDEFPVEVPDDAEPIAALDPYAVEIAQREASHFKGNPYGIRVRVPGSRFVDLGHISNDHVESIASASEWFRSRGRIWARTAGPGAFAAEFITNAGEQLEYLLAVRLAVLHEEAEPRSGAGRAAADDKVGTIRSPAKYEAAYDARKSEPLHKAPADTPRFFAQHYGDRIVAQIVHPGPWERGIRDPGQAQTMGSQNAKNYLVDFLRPGLTPAQKEEYRSTFPGRWEWLHLIGSSLGGPNTANNLVAGSYDANTKMIALEHRIARWGLRDYHGENAPTLANPIAITTEAGVARGTHAATRVRMQVQQGGRTIVTGEYDATDQRVITKSQYAEEEQRVDAAVEASRRAH